MHFLAKFKNILYMGFKATLNFRKKFFESFDAACFKNPQEICYG